MFWQWCIINFGFTIKELPFPPAIALHFWARIATAFSTHCFKEQTEGKTGLLSCCMRIQMPLSHRVFSTVCLRKVPSNQDIGCIHIEKLSCTFILSCSSPCPPVFLCTVYYFAVVPTPASRYTPESTASTCLITRVLITHHMRVDYSSHAGETLATGANLLPYL